MAVDYSGRMAEAYPAGRALSDDVLRMWADAAARHLLAPAGIVADIGAGTGRFSGALAQRLGRPLVAVEPAAGMREQARRAIAPGVSLIGGRAEAVPARSHCCALIWMSQSVHHVADLDACGQELRRVLIDGGRVLLRAMFDVRAGWPLAPYFPGAVEYAEARFPSLERVVRAFRRAGLELVTREEFEQTTVRNAEELIRRTRLRADSTLASLADDEFEGGLRRLEAAAAGGLLPGPITERLDLVSFA